MDLSTVVRADSPRLIKGAKVRTPLLMLALGGWVQYGESAQAYPTPVDLRGKLNRWHLHEQQPVLCYRVYSEYEEDAILFAGTIAEAAGQWSSISESRLVLIPCQDGELEQVSINLQQSTFNESYAAGFAEFDAYNEQGQPEHCSVHVLTDPGYPVEIIGKTVLHELGHCLGLEHSSIPEAIMSYHNEKNRFALDIDDKAAISRLYPLASQEVQLPPGCAIGANSTLPAGTNFAAVQLLLLLLIPLLLPLFF